MLLIPEIQLFTIIQKLLGALKSDFNNHADKTQTLLFRMFDGKKIGKFDFFEQGKEIFVDRLPEHPRQLKTRLFFDTERASLPTIHITLPSEATGASGIGTDEGFESALHAGGKFTPVLTRRFDLQYNIITTSDNVFEVILIYYTLRALLISTFTQLEFEGLSNPKLSGQDLRLYQEIIPRNVFARAIGLSVSYEDSSPSLFSKDEITKIIFSGKAIPGESIQQEILV